MSTESQCPVIGSASHQPTTGSSANQQWWPNQLNLRVLHQNTPASDPLGEDFDYATAFADIDLKALYRDLEALMTDSQEWWPADYGHYGPFFIRMAWHSAGTYRIQDGRGGARSGTQRFAPLNSWPDNGNLDKARRLLWPIKQKYGRSLSWADLMIFAGNAALESMGFKTAGFAGGREDIFEPEEDVYWGPETQWMGDERYSGDRELADPLGAVQMGLIYVNPEGPNGKPDPLASARDIRDTFARMAMNDEETVALVAGGHTFGKAHGAADPEQYVGREPEGADITEQGLGWKNSFGSGHGTDTITSGIEGAWTTKPTEWDNGYFDVLFGYDWTLTKSPAGAHQWTPTEASKAQAAPAAHEPGDTQALMMTTADMAMKLDPIYEPISRRFHEDPEAFAKAFAKAWYKLTHRDMGPYACGIGALVPSTPAIWQDPVPDANYTLINGEDAEVLKQALLDCGLSVSQLVNTAWASASTYRGSDKRGGANGARIRLAPQKDWAANNPAELRVVLDTMETVRAQFNATLTGDKHVSLADTIVLGGSAGIEKAARAAGHTATVPFTPGRTDASDAHTDAASFSVLEPTSDGFRNHLAHDATYSAEALLIDRAQLLTLSAPEMTVLVGGLRVLNANTGQSQLGVFTQRPETLSNDFFVNLLDLRNDWQAASPCGNVFVARETNSADVKWQASRVDLLFGSNSQLRAIAEVYASDDAASQFISDFVAAWTKVMMLDRFDLQ